MISIKELVLDSFDLNYIDVSWSINSNTDDILKYEFFVERGESPAGPFEIVAGPLVDRYHVRDNIAPRRMSWRQLYYRVTCKDTLNNTTVESPAKNLSARLPFDAIEMIRLFNLQLREFTGRPCLLFPLRTFGQRCVCFDVISQRRTVSSCKTCYNTGFIRGYHYPLLIYIQIDPYAKNKEVREEIISNGALTGAKTIAYPILKPGDILVEREGTRWRVQSVQNTERLRSPVQQNLNLFKITEGDIEFALPITWPSEYVTSPRSYNPKSDIGT
jgi:hypothetical protein